MRGLLAALLVQVALAGTCADSATLDYPAGLTGLERGSFATPARSSALPQASASRCGSTARTTDLEHLIHFYAGLSSTSSPSSSNSGCTTRSCNPSKFPSKEWVHVTVVQTPSDSFEATYRHPVERRLAAVHRLSRRLHCDPAPPAARDSFQEDNPSKIRDLYVWNARSPPNVAEPTGHAAVGKTTPATTRRWSARVLLCPPPPVRRRWRTLNQDATHVLSPSILGAMRLQRRWLSRHPDWRERGRAAAGWTTWLTTVRSLRAK